MSPRNRLLFISYSVNMLRFDLDCGRRSHPSITRNSPGRTSINPASRRFLIASRTCFSFRPDNRQNLSMSGDAHDSRYTFQRIRKILRSKSESIVASPKPLVCNHYMRTKSEPSRISSSIGEINIGITYVNCSNRNGYR